VATTTSRSQRHRQSHRMGSCILSRDGMDSI